MTARRLPLIARGCLLLLVGAGLAFVFGCGGAAGIENGTIVGKVFHDVDITSGSATQGPEPGVAVVAQRETGSLLIIRSTVSDANGMFVFTDIPEGPYVIGFQKAGFKPVTTESGSSANRSALGSQIRVFVEPGRTSIAPDVTITALQPSGNSIIIVTLLDGVTGNPVTNATLTIGPIAVTANQNGVYTISVPRVGNPNTNFPDPSGTVNLLITADGFQGQSVPDLVAPAGQTIRVTQSLTPVAVTLAGTVKVATFPALTDLSGISISVVNNTITGTSDGNGNWFVPPAGSTTGLPASSPALTRQISIVFSNPDLQTFTLANVTTPRVGTKTITTPVIMQRITVDVTGQVRDSSGNSPNGPADIVTISETGQQANIINGTYTIAGVPQSKVNQLTLIARAVNTSKNPPTTETNSGGLKINPLSDGSAHPVFVAPDIVTSATAGP